MYSLGGKEGGDGQKKTNIYQDLHERGEDVQHHGPCLPRPQRAGALQAALLEGLEDVLPLWLVVVLGEISIGQLLFLPS